MPECEICGAEVKRLYKVEIDGVVLNVCRECAKLGKRLDKPRKFVRRRKLIEGGEEIDESELDPEYAKKIVSARELLKYTREQLAKKLGVKLSFWERIEKGEAKPTMEIAKRVEHVLGVQIIKKPEKTPKTIHDVAQKKPKKKRKKKMKVRNGIPDEQYDDVEVKSKPAPQLTIGDIANIVVKKKKQ